MKVGCSKLQIFFYFALIRFVIPTAAHIIRYDTGNYTSNCTYRANLDGLLTSIIKNTKIDYGFYNFSAGESPDKAYAIALVLETLRPVNAVVASMSQDTTYCNLVQTKRRLSIGLGTKNV